MTDSSTDTQRVVLLHGLGADARAFQRFVRLLPAGWDARPLDLLGHGAGPHPEHGYALTDMAEHAAQQIEAIWPDDIPIAVVGHSLGAATAVVLTATHPQLVRTLVLLDPADIQTDGSALPIRAPGTRDMLRAKLDGTLRETVERVFASESPALRRWILESWTNMAPGVVREFAPSWRQYADRVQCPVTIVYGDPDLGAYGPGSLDAFHGRAHGVRIAGSGHNVHAWHARETAAAVVAAVSADV